MFLFNTLGWCGNSGNTRSKYRSTRERQRNFFPDSLGDLTGGERKMSEFLKHTTIKRRGETR